MRLLVNTPPRKRSIVFILIFIRIIRGVCGPEGTEGVVRNVRHGGERIGHRQLLLRSSPRTSLFTEGTCVYCPPVATEKNCNTNTTLAMYLLSKTSHAVTAAGREVAEYAPLRVDPLSRRGGRRQEAGGRREEAGGRRQQSRHTDHKLAVHIYRGHRHSVCRRHSLSLELG
ncbi:hypothetical protein EYF80_023168 [Liparis tanakae]|uniref:Secreted protein n=1 Tax=Liparis tanakae TaxID=230148 RepID=A0A4Z2HNT4_9TELE|nr:hypothetical protein EYF80_023168 [Liparis tanakae]